MDTNQPTPAEGLPDLTVEEFAQISQEAGGSGQFKACNYAHAFRIAQRAYAKGADAELEACCKWLEDEGFRQWLEDNDYDFQRAAVEMRDAMRPKPPTIKEQALAAARIEVNPHGKNGALIIRALEALPD
jgi:hypothetical protein